MKSVVKEEKKRKEKEGKIFLWCTYQYKDIGV